MNFIFIGDSLHPNFFTHDTFFTCASSADTPFPCPFSTILHQHQQIWDKLMVAVQQFMERNCEDIVWCLKVKANEITIPPFPKEEDKIVVGLVKLYGKKWWPPYMAVSIPECSGKQCQERLLNGNMINIHKVYRNIWMKLTKSLPTRAKSVVKKHWGTSTFPGKERLGPLSASGLDSQFHCPSLVGLHNGPTIYISSKVLPGRSGPVRIPATKRPESRNKESAVRRCSSLIMVAIRTTTDSSATMENLGDQKSRPCDDQLLAHCPCTCLLASTVIRLFRRTTGYVIWPPEPGPLREEQAEKLIWIIRQFTERNWKEIVECLKVQADEIISGPFPKEEDKYIVELVNTYGQKWWSGMAVKIPGCTGKQCRERWLNHRCSNKNNEESVEDEERALLCTHQVYRNIWLELTKFLPQRTENAVKKQSSKKRPGGPSASGLDSQFRALSLVGRPNPPTASISPTGTPQLKKIVKLKTGNRENARPRPDPISIIERREATVFLDEGYEPVGMPEFQPANKRSKSTNKLLCSLHISSQCSLQSNKTRKLIAANKSRKSSNKLLTGWVLNWLYFPAVTTLQILSETTSESPFLATTLQMSFPLNVGYEVLSDESSPENNDMEQYEQFGENMNDVHDEYVPEDEYGIEMENQEDASMDDRESRNEESAEKEGEVVERHVLLGVCGGVSAGKVMDICNSLRALKNNKVCIKVVLTESALRFIDRTKLAMQLQIYTDEEFWKFLNLHGPNPLYTTLVKEADVLVIAPLSANTLSKAAIGMCDNLLTCIMRAWPWVGVNSKTVILFPEVQPIMWIHPTTQEHVATLQSWGAKFGHPATNNVMAPPEDIAGDVAAFMNWGEG
ncbi:myb-related protein [Striga asiatica]|uniref:phosphopantothenoylcysteine decarboxylase n=1 Tax=Striga asiatica TaxID=4170 RepID=A0A5A7P649_STRAF|nr:myb-related protein [Striga asiatica]